MSNDGRVDADTFARVTDNDKEWRSYILLKLDTLHGDQKDHGEQMTHLRTTMDNFMTADLPKRVNTMEAAIQLLKDKLSLRTTVLISLSGAIPVAIGLGVWIIKAR